MLPAFAGVTTKPKQATIPTEAAESHFIGLRTGTPLVLQIGAGISQAKDQCGLQISNSEFPNTCGAVHRPCAGRPPDGPHPESVSALRALWPVFRRDGRVASRSRTR